MVLVKISHPAWGWGTSVWGGGVLPAVTGPFALQQLTRLLSGRQLSHTLLLHAAQKTSRAALRLLRSFLAVNDQTAFWKASFTHSSSSCSTKTPRAALQLLRSFLVFLPCCSVVLCCGSHCLRACAQSALVGKGMLHTTHPTHCKPHTLYTAEQAPLVHNAHYTTMHSVQCTVHTLHTISHSHL